MPVSRRHFLAVTLAGAAAAVLAQKSPRTIAISARRFAYTPAHIELARGEPVVFELTTEDIFMGFSLPDFAVRADIVPGKATRLALTPDRAGTFTFLCDVFCGEGHEGMNGTLVVT
jgi:cytochrome c oxidase subunit 2